MKAKLAKEGVPEDKILVLEDGVDIKRFDEVSERESDIRLKYNLPLDKKIIAYVGSLHKDKGINEILKLAELFSDNQEALFLLVGGTKEQLEYWEKIRIEKKLGNVKFYGFAPNSEAPFILKASDILILLYEPKPKRDFTLFDVETTSPIKLFEYMAAKKPIVASDIPTIRKVLTHNKSGILVENAEDAARKIERLLKDKTLCEDLSSAAYELAKNFTWEKRCNRIINYFNLSN